jgi:hypothetical protein
MQAKADDVRAGTATAAIGSGSCIGSSDKKTFDEHGN